MSAESWSPSAATKQAVVNFMEELLDRLPRMLGIDEIIAGCELINADTYSTGLIPRYVTAAVREYHLDIWYTGSVNLVVGDLYNVIHLSEGNRYELLGPSGGAGSYSAPTSTFGKIVTDLVTMEVVIDAVTGEVVSEL